MMDDYVFHNAKSLAQLKEQGVEIKRFPDEVLAAMKRESQVVLEDLAGQNELNGRIWKSMKSFQDEAAPMGAVTEKELYNWR